MEIIFGFFVLGVLFILFGGVEDRDNKSELGQEMIQSLTGPAKVAQENGSGCMMWGGFLITILVVAAVIASGGF